MIKPHLKQSKKGLILSVETSCDDTSVALVKEDGFVLFNQVMNQNNLGQAHGGVVPELASRNHAHYLLPLVELALKETGCGWQDLKGLAVTNRPGLIGSLIVGLVTVKTLAFLLNKPFIGVNHIEGHILSPFLWDKDTAKPDLKFPFLALIVSGGHTCIFVAESFGQYKMIAQAVDDSAGEALDKVARVLGLEYPGGRAIDRLSCSAQSGGYDFPKVQLKDESLNFSFSGLKTKAIQLIKQKQIAQNPQKKAGFCVDFQTAVVQHLMDRLNRASKEHSLCRSVVIAGGVSANSFLRQTARAWAKQRRLNLFLPHIKYCTDNAAMIGFTGLKWLKVGKTDQQNLTCYPSLGAEA